MKVKKCMKGILLSVCILAATGCGVSESEGFKNENSNTESFSDTQKKDTVIDEFKDGYTTEETDNTDGDYLIRSSVLQGSVVEFSDNSCVVTPVMNDGDTAVVAAVGEDDKETNVTISYEQDCIFEIAIMDIVTGKATVSKASVSDIKKRSSLLIYGDFEDTHNVSASKVIVVRYD